MYVIPKFNVGVVPADWLGRYTTKNFFYIVLIKWGSRSMSAGANPLNFRPSW
jgi:hypothetical protein